MMNQRDRVIQLRYSRLFAYVFDSNSVIASAAVVLFYSTVPSLWNFVHL